MVPNVVSAVACCMLLRAATAAGCAVPLQPTQKGYLVELRAGGAGPFRFLFDTGSSMTVVTPALAQQLSLDVTGTAQAQTTSGRVETGMGTIREVSVGGEQRDELSVLVAALPHFPGHGRIHGILGADFLAGRSYRIDLQQRCVTLDPAVSRGTRIEAEEVAGRLALKVDAMNLVLDSGASFPVLLSARARALARETGRFEMTTAAGIHSAASGVIERLRIGDVSLRGVAAAFAAQHDPREDALIPITLFREVYVAADRRSAVVR